MDYQGGVYQDIVKVLTQYWREVAVFSSIVILTRY